MNNKPKKTYSDEYKANRRKNQQAWLDKKRQDPEWVKQQAIKRAIKRGFQVTESLSPEELLKARIKADAGKINRLRLMYKMFEANSRALAGENRRKRLANTEHPDETSELADIGEEAIKAVKNNDIMPFVNEFQYQLYVHTHSKDGTKEELGPFCSPAQVRTVAGGLRPLVTLRKALISARMQRRAKQKSTPHK